MGNAADEQETLEGMLKDEIVRMYQEVADNPEGEFHFYLAFRRIRLTTSVSATRA